MNTEKIFKIDSTDVEYVTIEYGDYKFVYTDEHLWIVDTFVGDANFIDIGYYPEGNLTKMCNDIITLDEDYDDLETLTVELAEM